MVFFGLVTAAFVSVVCGTCNSLIGKTGRTAAPVWVSTCWFHSLLNVNGWLVCILALSVPVSEFGLAGFLFASRVNLWRLGLFLRGIITSDCSFLGRLGSTPGWLGSSTALETIGIIFSYLYLIILLVLFGRVFLAFRQRSMSCTVI